MNDNKDTNTSAAKSPKAIIRIIFKILFWIVGVWFALLVIMQIVLSSSVIDNLVQKYSKEYIDGDISFGRISVSMFRHFPNVGLTLEDFAITYPAEKFAESAKLGAQGHLMLSGCSEISDTLARFDKFSVSVNVPALLTGGISIPYLDLIQPKIFIHNYADGRSNLEVIKLTESEEDETSSSGLDLKLGKITFNNHPQVIFTDSKDTIFTVIDFKKLDFEGRINTEDLSKNKIGLNLDSMFVAGRVATDTLALAMDKLIIDEHHNHIDLLADAKSFIGTRTFGRLQIPIAIKAGIVFPKDTIPAVTIEHFDLNLASIPLNGSLDMRFHPDNLDIKSEMNVKDCKLDHMLKDLVSYFIPEANKISTDAKLSIIANCNGSYNYSTGKLPDFNISVKIPDSEIRHEDIEKTVRLEFDASASTDKRGRINVNIVKASVNTAGLSLTADGKVNNAISKDPMLQINSNVNAVLDTISSIFIPDSLGIKAKGNLEAGINGSAKLSQLNMYNFDKADLSGFVNCKNLELTSTKDSLDLYVDNMKVKLGPEFKKSRSEKDKKIKLLSLGGDVDSLLIAYKKAFEVKGKNLNIIAKNSINDKRDSAEVKPLGFKVKAGKFSIKDANSSMVSLDNSENSFLIYPKKDHSNIPVMTVSSKHKRIYLQSPTERVILTDAAIKAKAAMNTVERREKINAIKDSLSKVYPDVPKDSLFAHAIARSKSKPLPEWLHEEDFKKKDPDLRLDETFAKYFREWDLNGNLNVRIGILMTPHFPIRNILRNLDIDFTNDKVSIDTMTILSGSSTIAAKGTLSGIKRALLSGRSPLRLNLDITSDKMNTNELLTAYSAGSRFVAPKPGETVKNLENASNSEFLKMVTSEQETQIESEPLIVIPSNIIANINVNAQNITYSSLSISSLSAKMLMKERCVQITDTKAVSNAGNISFDGFYSTRSKKDLKTGFNFTFKDITAEKVISLMPAIDTIMPMLKSFRGLLNCELAATARIDTNMNIIMPSINGVMRINGDHLTISDSEMFSSIAEKLKFKNYKTGFIDKMTVEGVLKDNKLEVFPFVLKMDNYTMAMSGIQHLDMSFKYHISMIKSPLIFRFGVDIYGKDFDHLKFKVGKPKYKNTNIPVFSSVIDDTKINLLKSIKGIFEKGVEAAFNENAKQEAIEQKRKELEYINAVDQEVIPLSEAEQRRFNEEDTEGIEKKVFKIEETPVQEINQDTVKEVAPDVE